MSYAKYKMNYVTKDGYETNVSKSGIIVFCNEKAEEKKLKKTRN